MEDLIEEVSVPESEAINKDLFRIENASLAQWQYVIEWAAKEGWNIGLGDAEHFFKVDPAGFFIGFLNDKPVSAVSFVNFDESYSHWGHFIVDPKLRGRNYGIKLLDKGLTHAGSRSIGGDGNVQYERGYGRWGAKTHYQTLRLVGVIDKNQLFFEDNFECITSDNLEEVIDYDKQCLGYSRRALLNQWFFGEGRHGFLARSGENIVGILGVRKSIEGYRIGPFYTENDTLMKSLFQKGINSLPEGSQLTVDAPQANDGTFIQFATSLGMKEVFRTNRMFIGTELPQSRLESIHAIATLELG
ncbi:GNAT family N-acetyltransferase [Algicola sagamiensis]|uniref:GNAT family N-acetyltransferase n=1 Tax=Algicola sagamiensis TaxID=163869 RepID=UPI000376ED64|nr:GNAT family N-acetyltransferase [Algicola sagamiensis]